MSARDGARGGRTTTVCERGGVPLHLLGFPLGFPWVSLRFPLGSCTKCAQSVEDGKGKDGCQV